MANNKLITKELQCSFPHLFEAYAPVEGAKAKYTVTLLIDKNDTQTIAQVNQCIDAAIEQGVSKVFGGKTPSKSSIRPVLKDGDEKDRPEFKGKWLLVASSVNAPEVVDQNLNPIYDKDAIVGGDYIRISANFKAYKVGQAGVSVYLQNVQLVRKAEKPFGGKTTASSDFASVNNKDFM